MGQKSGERFTPKRSGREMSLPGGDLQRVRFKVSSFNTEHPGPFIFGEIGETARFFYPRVPNHHRCGPFLLNDDVPTQPRIFNDEAIPRIKVSTIDLLIETKGIRPLPIVLRLLDFTQVWRLIKTVEGDLPHVTDLKVSMEGLLAPKDFTPGIGDFHANRKFFRDFKMEPGHPIAFPRLWIEP